MDDSRHKWSEENLTERWTDRKGKAQPTHLDRLRAQRLKAYKKWRAGHPEKYMWYRYKARAEETGIPFTLAPEDIVIPEKCPVLGVEFAGVEKNDYKPALALIDQKLGYVPGNILVVCAKVKRIKSNTSLFELAAITEFYRNLSLK